MLFDKLSSTLTPCFSSLPSLLNFTVSVGKYRFVSAFKHGLRGNIAYGTMQTPGIVMGYEVLDNCPGFFKRQQTQGVDTLSFQALVPALDLPVALGLVGGSSHMAHTTNAYELLKVPGYELRPIV